MTPLPTIPHYPANLSSDSLKYWTVQDYDRMSDLGIFNPSERTELIAGQIVLMLAKGTAHVVSLQLLADVLRQQLGDTALIRTQDSVVLDDFSEPEPDLAIVKGSILDYTDHHPLPADIYLVIEVANSTLKYDCEVKDKLYAQAGIPEYWVINLQDRRVHVFQEPTPNGYLQQIFLTELQTISALAFPEIAFPIASILPPL